MFKPGKLLLSCLLSLTVLCVGQPAEAAEEAVKPYLEIVINVPGRTLSLYDNEKLLKVYPVGVGRADSQTPLGDFKIKFKEKNPIWVSPSDLDVRIRSGPENPLGYRWMEIAPLYGIHGTNRPDSIGGYVSNGCIRMYESDVEELFDKVPLKTPVKIEYERLLVERTDDGSVYMTVYSDAYWKQALSLSDVRKKLESYGVNVLISDAKLQWLLRQSDGQRHRLIRTYPVYMMGKKLELDGIIGEDGLYYIPAAEAAQVANVAVKWDYSTGLLTGINGSAKAKLYNDIVYLNSDYAYMIFGTYVNWRGNHEAIMLDNFKY